MADVQSMLSSVIGAGKTVVHKIGADEIRRLIENQPEINGDVDVGKPPLDHVRHTAGTRHRIRRPVRDGWSAAALTKTMSMSG